jgi:hypothetical protein
VAKSPATRTITEGAVVALAGPLRVAVQVGEVDVIPVVYLTSVLIMGPMRRVPVSVVPV